MSNIAGVLLESGIAYPSWAHWFTPICRWGPCCSY